MGSSLVSLVSHLGHSSSTKRRRQEVVIELQCSLKQHVANPGKHVANHTFVISEVPMHVLRVRLPKLSNDARRDLDGGILDLFVRHETASLVFRVMRGGFRLHHLTEVRSNVVLQTSDEEL
jgi:hypothetical protein